jgi:glutamate dehydrogenase
MQRVTRPHLTQCASARLRTQLQLRTNTAALLQSQTLPLHHHVRSYSTSNTNSQMQSKLQSTSQIQSNQFTNVNQNIRKVVFHTGPVSQSNNATTAAVGKISPFGSQLLNAASAGDLPALEQLLKQDGVTVNDGDYDRRRPLHLAAAEGRANIVQYLVDRNADVNIEDRWGHTALDEALTNRQEEVMKILLSRGAKLGRAHQSDMGNILCQAGAEGNVQYLQLLLACNVDINAHDYDFRTCLHIAASEGHVSTVEFLLQHGAKVNAVDRFGNTPLGNASRSRSRQKKQVMQLLKDHGAELESSDYEIKTDSLVQSSIARSLPFIMHRCPHAVHIEAWLPNIDETEFGHFEASSYTNKESVSKLSLFTSQPPDAVYLNSPTNLLGKAWKSKEAEVFTDITERDLPNRWQHAKEVGLRSGIVLPILLNDKPYAVIKVFFDEQVRLSADERSRLMRFASGLITAGIFKKSRAPAFSPELENYKNQMTDVYLQIVNEEVFNANLVFSEVDWYYSLGLQKYYFERFAASEIANHVHAFIAAKKVAATTGRPEEIMLSIESKAVDNSPSWLYMCPYEHTRQVEVEKIVQSQIMKLSSNTQRSYTLECFMSQRPIIPNGTKQMGLYVLESSEWNDPKAIGNAAEHELEKVASVAFLRTKTAAIRERYQSIIKQTVHKLTPVATVFPTYRDGTTPIMFSFYQAAGTTTSYMLQLTELLKSNHLVANRKFIETFANGIIVYSLYLQPAVKSSIDNLLKQFSMLHLVPESTLTSRFLSGEYSAESYTYHSASARFVYYFLNRKSEEFDVLAKALKSDPLNFGRLRLLQQKLKREAVSHERIYACLINHPTVAVELFKHFYQVATNVDGLKIRGEVPTLPADIVTKIKNEATTLLDQQILLGMLSFNVHLLKTNVYNKSKASLAFRFDPRFLNDSDLPQTPYGVFFLMGSDFQGFHIRFRDVARGGIRIIRSGDRAAYTNNLETLFTENYGLAYTQNKKNKDIPEFGSKGTILLNLTNQTTPFLAFQKYTSGLLDLIIPRDDIIDNYGKEELLFLGPDEGTADYMEWAARYAAKREYPYWRSFTTGKPTSLGGIPHDKFGMTTRSVHRTVMGCLEKLNLPEESVTKLQTGGPDGDLGSNEILISKDKTIAIVDGSGVVYSPEGLNREELSRLAKKRAMIREFDVSKLGEGGFRVLVTDNNVTLPTGEKVESGLVFRNEFHLHPLASADLFVPCGGRPESVNLSNVNKLFDEKGKPRFKIIVEGANLFFTQDARMVLENAGVILYKDASANKGGVTSSSLEVLAALALNNEEFEQHMCVKDDVIPQFYEKYVQEIQRRIEADAYLEFSCIWAEHERTQTPRYLLTDQVSDKINSLNDFIQKSSLWENKALRLAVLHHAIPNTLQELIGLEKVLERIPESYAQAIFGAYMASRYVYKFGLAANEMQFFEFLQPYLTESLSIASGQASIPTVNVKEPVQSSSKSSTQTNAQTVPPTSSTKQQRVTINAASSGKSKQ